MSKLTIFLAIAGIVSFSSGEPVADGNWIMAGNPELLKEENNPAIKMINNMGRGQFPFNFPALKFPKIPSPDKMVDGIQTSGGKGFHGMASVMKSESVLNDKGEWVNKHTGKTVINDEGKVTEYEHGNDDQS